MTTVEGAFRAMLQSDVQFGYLDGTHPAARQFNPEVVVNSGAGSMLRVLREELRHCTSFSFSVAFVSPRAIALLKQEFVEFSGEGRIFTSDYLGFNSPQAFAELLNLEKLGIQARLHTASAYHPKAYVFEHADRVTAVLGSSNLTESALVSNHEWNLKVTAALGSDLADQLRNLTEQQAHDSVAITDDWLDRYSAAYSARPPAVATMVRIPVATSTPELGGSDLAPTVDSLQAGTTLQMSAGQVVDPNAMQREALARIGELRQHGSKRALVISATGTGKTILAALDVRAVDPGRMLFVVHREQIIDKAISEFKRVLDAPDSAFGKFSGGTHERDRKYVFATIQTLSRPEALARFGPDDFDYILVDEVHRAGATTYGKVLEHFEPEFLLGMTATPERSDGFSVFELFDFNVPYEIRLNRALEEGMLSPFHYYGVTDATFEDNRTASVESGLSELVSKVRVNHIVEALETYSQAGVEPRGLIFCSRVDEAVALAEQLNQTEFRGRALRTKALSGISSIPEREASVRELERGELDYLLTVNVFNEGVDIPSVNQVVMLRQTQSAIVFVQQLGRALRKHPDKEYAVVIDFIGNYANNYLIPIALFGDESLNKESLRKNLLAAEESGVIAGLSSVRFDKIAQERVLKSISDTKLDSAQHLKFAFEILRNRLGMPPMLADFYRFDSADPVLVATKFKNYVRLVEKFTKTSSGMSKSEHLALDLLSQEALTAKRVHELLVLSKLIEHQKCTVSGLVESINADGWAVTRSSIESALATYTLGFFHQSGIDRYRHPLLESVEGNITLTSAFQNSYAAGGNFRAAVDDLIATGLDLIGSRYGHGTPFVQGMQYSRKDASRLLGWDKNGESTIFGYRVDERTRTCPIFVTYHKAEDISASTTYEDELLDRRTMRWYTRSRVTLDKREALHIIENEVALHVFVKKDDADGSDHFYLGRATAHDPEQTTMLNDRGQELDIVRMKLVFDEPIDVSVYDYFHPTVMV